MLRLFLVLATLVLTLGSASAVTLGPAQCREDDWSKIGRIDGYYGYSASRFDQYTSSCAQYGIMPNLKLYKAGYANGLKLHCTLDRAVTEGTSGNPYRKVCTGEIGASFARVYAQAHNVYLASTRDEEIRDNRSRSPDDIFLLLRPLDLFDTRVGSVREEEQKLNMVLDTERHRLKALGIKG